MVARQEQQKWCYFKRHLFARRVQRDGLGLQQFDAIIPRIDLHASSEGQGGNLIELIRLERRAQARKLRAEGHAVSKPRVDERGKG